MYIIVWDYQVRPEHLPDFEKIYARDGDWSKLFSKSDGYLGTELLRDETDTHHFLTIDRWVSSEGYEAFLIQWKKEYQTLDAQCEAFTRQESMVGKWESISHELR